MPSKPADAPKKPKTNKALADGVPFKPEKLPEQRIKFTVEQMEDICSQLVEGKTLQKVLNQPGMPNRRTFWRWLVEHEECHRMYDRARELQAEGFIDQIMDLADNTADDTFQIGDKVFPNPNAIQRARLQIDTRKWWAGKLLSRKYGEHVEVHQSHSVNVQINDEQATRIAQEYLRLRNDPDVVDIDAVKPVG